MAKIKLIISIFGDLLDPHALAKIAKIEPTAYWYKGDTIPNRPNNLERKETCWEYSYGFIETLFLDEISNKFIQKFMPNLNDISDYIYINKLEAKIFIVVEIQKDEPTPSLSLDRNFLEIISKINGEIDIDLYIVDSK